MKQMLEEYDESEKSSVVTGLGTNTLFSWNIRDGKKYVCAQYPEPVRFNLGKPPTVCEPGYQASKCDNCSCCRTHELK